MIAMKSILNTKKANIHIDQFQDKILYQKPQTTKKLSVSIQEQSRQQPIVRIQQKKLFEEEPKT